MRGLVRSVTSLLEFGPRDPALPDDGQDCPYLQLGMIGHGNGHRPAFDPALHHDVTPSPLHLDKAMSCENLADLPPRQNWSLAMNGFESRYEDLAVETLPEFLRIRALQE